MKKIKTLNNKKLEDYIKSFSVVFHDYEITSTLENLQIEQGFRQDIKLSDKYCKIKITVYYWFNRNNIHCTSNFSVDNYIAQYVCEHLIKLTNSLGYIAHYINL